MGRALVVYVLGAPLLAWSWLRLESGHDAGQATLVLLLALLPALVRAPRLQAAVAAVALLGAGAIAFDLGPSWRLPGQVPARFGSGFLEFYDVQVPFNVGAHPKMHGVLLLAVFAFALAVALAAAACRPGLVALVLVVGVGWPGTLLPGHDLLRGSLLLATVLVCTTVLRRGPVHGLGPALAAGFVVMIAAIGASSSPALAKQAFLGWQHWDLYTKPAKPVDVSYVWDSSYRRLVFHGKPTVVFRVKAGAQPHYWRISVLNSVEGGRWFEDPTLGTGDYHLIGEQGLVPLREQRFSGWEREEVTVEALRDQRLPGGSVPVRYRPGAGVGQVSTDPSGVVYAAKPLSRGDTYKVWSYSPSPTPAQLAASKPLYAGPILAPRRKYREVQPGVFPPLFGTPDRAARVRYLFTEFARADQLRPYARLYAKAEEVAGGARSPYAAAVALERWFRFGGNFLYDTNPPSPPPGVPPLEYFVSDAGRRGYCQHFAGAMALMLRYLGIPSRVAVGFTSGVYSTKDGEWSVSDRDAHMWVEVWFRGWGWLPFDPTPGTNGLPGKYSTSSPTPDLGAVGAVLASAHGLRKFGTLAKQLGFQEQQPRTSPDVPDLGAAGLAATTTPGRGHDWGILRLLVFALAGVALLLAAAKLALRASRFLTRDPRRLASACRKELRDFLLDQGVDVPPSATLRELAQLVESEFGVEAGAFGLHATAARFGPRRGAREAARAMRRDLRALRRDLRAELTRFERVRGLLSLRSLGLAG